MGIVQQPQSISGIISTYVGLLVHSHAIKNIVRLLTSDYAVYDYRGMICLAPIVIIFFVHYLLEVVHSGWNKEFGECRGT